MSELTYLCKNSHFVKIQGPGRGASCTCNVYINVPRYRTVLQTIDTKIQMEQAYHVWQFLLVFYPKQVCEMIFIYKVNYPQNPPFLFGQSFPSPLLLSNLIVEQMGFSGGSEWQSGHGESCANCSTSVEVKWVYARSACAL